MGWEAASRFDSLWDNSYDCAVMCDPLPERIHPARLALEHTRLSGRIPLSAMPRLLECLQPPAGKANAVVELEFSNDSDARTLIRGHAHTRVSLRCQRCLEPVDWPLDARFSLALVHSDDEAAALPDDYEPLLWPGESGSLAELVEDELLLAMPAVPRHADAAACGPLATQTQHEPAPGADRDDNPFAVLEQLKQKDGN